MIEKNIIMFLIFFLLRYGEQSFIIQSDFSLFFKTVLLIFSLLFDFLLGIAANEEEFQAVIYYISNLNHWRYDVIKNNRRVDTLYSENTLPLWIFICSMGAKIGIYFGAGLMYSVFAPFACSFLIYFYNMDDQKTISFVNTEKKEIVNSESSTFLKINNENEQILKENSIQNFYLTLQYWIWLYVFHFFIVFFYYKEISEGSIFEIWKSNFAGIFAIYPLLDKFNRKEIFKIGFLINIPFFLFGNQQLIINMMVFIFNYAIFIMLNEKIPLFMILYGLLNVDLGLASRLELPMEPQMKSIVFIWKLLVFLCIIAIFTIIFRPKKQLLKYASFLKEM